jgi:hypothetical protein
MAAPSLIFTKGYKMLLEVTSCRGRAPSARRHLHAVRCKCHRPTRHILLLGQRPPNPVLYSPSSWFCVDLLFAFGLLVSYLMAHLSLSLWVSATTFSPTVRRLPSSIIPIPLPTSLATDAQDRRKCLVYGCRRPWKEFKMWAVTP